MIEVDRKSNAHPITLGGVAHFVLQLREAGEPILLTINGQEPLVVAGGDRDPATLRVGGSFGDSRHSQRATSRR